MDTYSFEGFGSLNQDTDQLGSFSSSTNTYENAFNFFGHPGMSVRKESDFNSHVDLHTSGLSGVSTQSDDEADDVDGHAGFILPTEPVTRKRKLDSSDDISLEDVKARKVERSGNDNYSIDGQEVPRLQLGESGRAQLKSSISSVLKRRPELRKQCNSIEKVKNASIMQLLAMARICGIWDQAVKISEGFLKKYPCKKIAASVDKEVSRLGEMALTSIL